MIAQLLAMPGMRFLHHWNKGTLSGNNWRTGLLRSAENWAGFLGKHRHMATGRQTLASRKPVAFQFEWQQNDQCEYTVEMIPDQPITQHFWLNGKLWYIDTHTLSCGLLQHPDLSAAQVEKFLNAPPIPAEQAESGQ